jgi:hypothetical protein
MGMATGRHAAAAASSTAATISSGGLPFST